MKNEAIAPVDPGRRERKKKRAGHREGRMLAKG